MRDTNSEVKQMIRDLEQSLESKIRQATRDPELMEVTEMFAGELGKYAAYTGKDPLRLVSLINPDGAAFLSHIAVMLAAYNEVRRLLNV